MYCTGFFGCKSLKGKPPLLLLCLVKVYLLWAAETRCAVQRVGTGAAAAAAAAAGAATAAAAAAAIRVLQQEWQGETDDTLTVVLCLRTQPTMGGKEGAGAGRPSTTTTQAPHRETGSLGRSELPPAARGTTSVASATYCSTQADQSVASEPSENF